MLQCIEALLCYQWLEYLECQGPFSPTCEKSNAAGAALQEGAVVRGQRHLFPKPFQVSEITTENGGETFLNQESKFKS